MGPNPPADTAVCALARRNPRGTLRFTLSVDYYQAVLASLAFQSGAEIIRNDRFWRKADISKYLQPLRTIPFRNYPKHSLGEHAISASHGQRCNLLAQQFRLAFALCIETVSYLRFRRRGLSATQWRPPLTPAPLIT
jgi:hypothetical protein